MDSRRALHDFRAITSSYACTNPCTDADTHTSPHARTNTQPNTWRLQAMVFHKPQTLVQKMHLGQVRRMLFVPSGPYTCTNPGAYTCANPGTYTCANPGTNTCRNLQTMVFHKLQTLVKKMFVGEMQRLPRLH